MFVEAIKKINKAIFPIFKQTRNGDQITYSVDGTGFFISPEGHFLSTNHIFSETSPETGFFFRGLIPDEIQNPALEIREIAKDQRNDIFVGKIELKTKNFLVLSPNSVDIGRTVCIAGYPLPKLKFNPQQQLEVDNVRRYFQPSFVLDKTLCGIGEGVVHDGFLIRDVGLFGMSGGPVFDINGEVLGMQGSVTSPRVSGGGEDRTISVENAVAIRSDLIYNFLKLKNLI